MRSAERYCAFCLADGIKYDYENTNIPFATSGGSGMGETSSRLKPSCGGAKLLEGRVFRKNTSKADLAAWVQGLE